MRPSPTRLPISYRRLISHHLHLDEVWELLPWPPHNRAVECKPAIGRLDLVYKSCCSLLGPFASVCGTRIKGSRPLWFILHFAIYVSIHLYIFKVVYSSFCYLCKYPPIYFLSGSTI